MAMTLHGSWLLIGHLLTESIINKLGRLFAK